MSNHNKFRRKPWGARRVARIWSDAYEQTRDFPDRHGWRDEAAEVDQRDFAQDEEDR